MKKPLPKLPKWHWAGPTETIWILVDISNSNQWSKNYLWWFETRALARRHLDHMRKTYGLTKAQLIGPYQFTAVNRRWRPRRKTPRGPSLASLKKMPEVDFSKVKIKRNPYVSKYEHK